MNLKLFYDGDFNIDLAFNKQSRSKNTFAFFKIIFLCYLVIFNIHMNFIMLSSLFQTILFLVKTVQVKLLILIVYMTETTYVTTFLFHFLSLMITLLIIWWYN